MNTRFLTIGVAAAALGLAGVVAVSADPPPAGAPRAERHRPFGDLDANSDGFVSRAEVQAHTERAFDAMDTNDDNKLDSADRSRMRMVEKRVIRKSGEGKDIDKEIENIIVEHGGSGGDGERRVIVRKHDGKGGDRHGGPRVHRMRGGGMPFMMLMHSDEADTNGDGALSKQEMVAQHLRFFDAADVNGDGKVKFDPPAPPTPPTPPLPPTPPTPPR